MFSYRVSMMAPVCCVCLQVLAVCTCICASNVSLYRRTHVHPYLPGCTHQLAFICMHTQVFTTHTTNIYAHGLSHISTRYVVNLRQHYGREARETSSPPPPFLYLCQPFVMYQGRLLILLPRSLRIFNFMLNSLISTSCERIQLLK